MEVIIFIMLMVAGVSLYDYFDTKDWQSTTSNSRNSVIFEHRNKKYGAYHLRRDYNDSFGIIIGGVILLLAIFFIVNVNVRTTTVHVVIPHYDTTLLTIAAPPIEEIKTIKTPYKVIGGGGGGSAGTASKNPVDRNTKDQNSKPVINSNNHDPAGESDHSNSKKPTKNPATTLIKGESPFEGGGAKKGKGSGLFGKDPGPGSGVGEGNGTNGTGSGLGGGARKKLTNLNQDDIQSNEDCTISLTVFINAEGDVVNTQNNSQTTTTNNALINKLRELVKKQIKYDKRPGSALQKQVLTIKVKAT